ncbi:trehalose-phosphatase [Thermincola ferriacetica]|uniref:trehalose-phosphatase n=1 Tax=Thermincola ferriacetica TaxID=281456 RepID=UPI00068CF311|nr:trehalose-phosphatase [Thermincola ferriacetica]
MNQLSAWREGTPEFLAALVLSHPKLLLMTDYDGTLVPIRERPEIALPGPGLLKVLKRLVQKSRVKVAIISGRDLEELNMMLPVAGIYLAGCHGAEIVGPGDEKIKTFDDTELDRVLDEIYSRLLSFTAGKQGFLAERKKTAVALHYRLADPAIALKVVGDFVAAVRPLVNEKELEFLAGKKVIEVRPKAVNKGEAVSCLMNLYPDFYPVYLGDDTTDEDAFKAVRNNGLGILVAGEKKFTAAEQWLRGSQDVLRFMQIIAARC